MTESLLTAERLDKSFGGRRVLRDVSVRISAGEVVGLLGPNGAGKTTTFYMIVGLLRPDAGRVALNGVDVTDLPMYQRARAGISYLPQEASVFRKLTVEENVLAILETLPISAEERQGRLWRLLEELSIAHLAKTKAYALSGGERRRLEITRALVISPAFMLLDEPFAGIDPIAVLDIQNIIRQLKERGIGVLITDHNVRETLGICDRAYILNEGSILEEGIPSHIAESRQAREIYLGERFSLYVMALETKLYQKLTQQLVMTPQLRMAIKILQVGRMELEALIVDEMSQNPVLEEVAEATEEQQKADTTFETSEVPTVDGTVASTTTEEWKPNEDAAPEVTAANALGEIDWKDYLDNYGNDFHSQPAGSSNDHDEDKRPALENTLVKTSSLVDHLMWQLRLSDLNEQDQTIIGVLITNLDYDGYLRLPLEEAAFMAGTDLEQTERLLRVLQGFDPPGVAARTLSECLLLQLAQLGQADSLAAVLVRDHLPALEGKRFDKLARELKVTTNDIAEAQKVIATLEPKPGRDYGDGDVRYVTPDVYIQKVGDELVVTLNDEGLPRLRVSQFYRRVLGQGESSEAKGYIQDKMRAAAWLIKSIHQRQRTLFMVTHSIIKFQREFFEHGVSHLKPLVLKDVANDIGMHESTVSRATANKYAHTPQGIYELKYFFTSSLRGADGEDVSAESVRKKIKEIIGSEDPSSPFSDQSIAEKLAKDNIDIARRTVAKYRELMGILPSSKRRQFA